MCPADLSVMWLWSANLSCDLLTCHVACWPVMWLGAGALKVRMVGVWPDDRVTELAAGDKEGHFSGRGRGGGGGRFVWGVGCGEGHMYADVLWRGGEGGRHVCAYVLCVHHVV